MRGSVGRARDALASADFRRLLGSRLVSSAGDGLFNAAVIGAAAFDTGQHTATGLARALAILIVPYSLIGPFTGVFIDRWSRRRILVIAPLVRALTAVPLALLVAHPGSWGFLTAGLIAAGVNRFLSATAAAVTPRLVPDEDLLMANSMASIGSTVTMAIFAFTGGLLIDHLGTRAVFVALATAWLAAAALARTISTDLAAPHASRTRLHHDLARVLGGFVDSARQLSRSPAALAPVVTISLDQVLQAVVFVLSIVVFRDRFREGVGSYSWLIAAGAIGLGLGVTTVGKLEERMSKSRIITLAFAVSGTGLLAATLSITRTTVLIQALLVGLAYAWKKIPVDTLVQEAVPDDFRGRVFAVYDVGFNVGRVAGTVAAVWLIPAAGVRGTLALCGIGFIAWIPVFARWVSRPTGTDTWSSRSAA